MLTISATTFFGVLTMIGALDFGLYKLLRYRAMMK